MSKELNVIGVALESIKNDNLYELDKALKIMPIESIVDSSETLLATFLSLCAGYNRSEACKMILERWKVVYPDNDKLSILSRLFLKITINIATLSFIVSIHPEFTFVEFIDELREFDSSPEVAVACGRAEEIYGIQPHETYKMLRDQAREAGNFVIEEYMNDKIGETAPYAERPKYVKNYLTPYYSRFEKVLPKEKELYEIADTESKKETKSDDIELPSDEEAVNMLTDGLKSFGISIVEIDAAKNLIRKEISNIERKKELLLPILEANKQKELESDRLLFWVYGPNNPLLGQNLNLDTPSAKYGGGRMFLFNLFDYDEENDYIADWFTGTCSHCLLKIRNRWDAVRKPVALGGWKGEYCSWECVRKDHEETENREGDRDILTEKLIDAFSKKMEEIGIQDRTNF